MERKFLVKLSEEAREYVERYPRGSISIAKQILEIPPDNRQDIWNRKFEPHTLEVGECLSAFGRLLLSQSDEELNRFILDLRGLIKR